MISAFKNFLCFCMSSLDLSSILRESDIQIPSKLHDAAARFAIRELRDHAIASPSDDPDASALSVNSSYSQQRARLKASATNRPFVGGQCDSADRKTITSAPHTKLPHMEHQQAPHTLVQTNIQTERPSYRSTCVRTPDASPPHLSFTLQRRLSSLLSASGSGISAAAAMSVVELNSFLESSKQFSSPEIDEILIFFEYQRLVR